MHRHKVKGVQTAPLQQVVGPIAIVRCTPVQLVSAVVHSPSHNSLIFSPPIHKKSLTMAIQALYPVIKYNPAIVCNMNVNGIAKIKNDHIWHCRFVDNTRYVRVPMKYGIIPQGTIALILLVIAVWDFFLLSFSLSPFYNTNCIPNQSYWMELTAKTIHPASNVISSTLIKI